MKRLLGTTSLVVAGALALSVSAHAQTTTLTFVSWGGAYTASQQKAYHE